MKNLILVGLAFASLARAESNCFIDGANVPRCYAGKVYTGVSWPVYTADNPLEVLRETERRWPAETGQSVLLPLSKSGFKIQHVAIRTGKDFPDVICFVFERGSQTCFDTMEITER